MRICARGYGCDRTVLTARSFMFELSSLGGGGDSAVGVGLGGPPVGGAGGPVGRRF